jgi:hypothetical protein
MHKQNYIAQQSFRFSRWSRSGYAVFRSLSLCVTIGKLDSDICEKAFCKLKGAIQKILAFVLLENDIAEEENPDEFIKQNQLEQILINYTVNSAVAASVVVVVFHCCLTVGIRLFLISTVFFVTPSKSPSQPLSPSGLSPLKGKEKGKRVLLGDLNYFCL